MTGNRLVGEIGWKVTDRSKDRDREEPVTLRKKKIYHRR